MKKLALMGAVLAGSLLLTGCASDIYFPITRKAYEGDDRPEAELAVIQNQYDERDTHLGLWVSSIDDTFVAAPFTSRWEVLPGERIITVHQSYKAPLPGTIGHLLTKSDDVYELMVPVEAGHVYGLRGNDKWIWFVDIHTREVVARIVI